MNVKAEEAVEAERQFNCRDDSVREFNSRTASRPYSITPDIEYYFCTDTIVGWQCVIASPELFQAIIDSFTYCRKDKGLKIHGYVIMPNHVHTILSAAGGNLSDILRDYKRFTSRKISSLLREGGKRELVKYFAKAARCSGRGNDFKIWQSGSHAEAVFTEPFFRQKLEYIHQNPVRKGFVAQPEDWLYLSARNYILDDESVMAIDRIQS